MIHPTQRQSPAASSSSCSLYRTGTWLTLQGVEFAFYQLPAPVACTACRHGTDAGKRGFNKNLETFFKGG
uniref:hypothetical protein n=1 Tax=Aeromonas salmonicida TaxID=645 RepID=UPI00215B53DB|nr:hypothetical protein [Aeromonas salmonicida]